ncbi:MAG: lytic transglycosylase domain-containing protein [Emcibacter sp.]|nr:lytic transglycosylase domain-containing protein [Emcibacter sp.]
MMHCALPKRIMLLWLLILCPGFAYGETSSLPTTQITDITTKYPIEITTLAPSDVKLYKRIFNLQAKGKWRKADRLIKQLDKKLLLGHVLYQRYMHPTAYSSRYKELAKWMLNYPDHPGAKRIYALAKKKNRGNVKKLHKPLSTLALNFPADKPIRKKKTKTEPVVAVAKPNTSIAKPLLKKKADRVDVYRLKKKIKRYLRRRSPERAEKRLWAFESRALLSSKEFNILLADIAGGYFSDNQDAKALALGKIAAGQARDIISQPDWIAGLAAWRLNDCSQAAMHFEKVAYSSVAGDWTAAAGSYWAARAYLICRQPEKVTELLYKATSFHRTFYGLIAARQLGQKPSLNWAAPLFTKDHYDLIKGIQSVQRTIALSQIDKIMLADMELSNTWRRARDYRHEALLGLAAKLGLAGTQLKIGKIEEQKRRTALDSTLYPIPNTEPEGGFTIDRALMFGIMRQESEFNSWAKSHAGARGLMQVMPRTASYISSDRSLRYGSRIKLDDPRYNMALGQQYVHSMLGKGFSGGNLFKTLTAYNAGPGNLRKWERKTNFQNDPLLFIETIPARETRNYIERVISNYWIYRMRMQQPTRSLDMVAMGGWPMYIPQDDNKDKRQEHASR